MALLDDWFCAVHCTTTRAQEHRSAALIWATNFYQFVSPLDPFAPTGSRTRAREQIGCAPPSDGLSSQSAVAPPVGAVLHLIQYEFTRTVYGYPIWFRNKKSEHALRKDVKPALGNEWSIGIWGSLGLSFDLLAPQLQVKSRRLRGIFGKLKSPLNRALPPNPTLNLIR